jgi:hypothetical protein
MCQIIPFVLIAYLCTVLVPLALAATVACILIIFRQLTHVRSTRGCRCCCCSGLTNYQKAIHDALQEFAQPGLGAKNKHLLFLTDGAPTQGDAELEEEQAWAKRLGVSIHTVFIGDGDYPEILDTLALATGGARFQAIPEYESGVIRLHDREEGPAPAVRAPIDAAAEILQAARDASNRGATGTGDASGTSSPGSRGMHHAVGGEEGADGPAAVFQTAGGTQEGSQQGQGDSPASAQGGLHKDDLASKGRLSKEEMDRAMQMMALGRSPVSGNPVTGKGRFG